MAFGRKGSRGGAPVMPGRRANARHGARASAREGRGLARPGLIECRPTSNPCVAEEPRMLSVFLVAIELTMATGLWTAHALVDRRAPAVLRNHAFAQQQAALRWPGYPRRRCVPN